jgi:hypothetical protein
LGEVSTRALKWAAVLFAGLALLAGGLQWWAFAATGGPRHLVLGVFAVSVGISVLTAVIGSRRGEHGMNAAGTANTRHRSS